jgi:ABC-type branched-subunit amino acid transport system ATPase component
MVAPEELERKTPAKIKGAWPVVLRIEGLAKAFGGQQVLDGVNAELRRGEVVILRGDNGTGKTTLLNILTGNLEADAGTIDLFTNGTHEHFHFPRRWWQDLNPFDHFTPERMAWEGVGRTWQDVRLFSTQSLRDNLAIAVPEQIGENPLGALTRLWQVRRQQREQSEGAREVLRRLGLDGREDSSADRISLGQSKRVAIARAVQAGARILFLDEPLAGLDGQGIEQVLGMLEQVAHQQQITMVIVEHVFHIPRLLDLADRIWTLADGCLTVQDSHEVHHEYQERSGGGLRQWLEEVAGPEGRVTDQSLPGGALLSIARRQSDRANEPLLEVCDLVIRRGLRLVIGQETTDGVEGLTFAVHEGDIAILQAPNGWGKTTLVEAIAGMLPVSAGTIYLRRSELPHLPAWQRRQLGLVTLQSQPSLFPSLTLRETLHLTSSPLIPSYLMHISHRPIGALSAGEKQQAALACAFRADSSYMYLLDEPFAAVDHTHIRKLQQDLRDLAKRSTFLITTPNSRVPSVKV